MEAATKSIEQQINETPVSVGIAPIVKQYLAIEEDRQKIFTEFHRLIGATPAYVGWMAIRRDWIAARAELRPSALKEAHEKAWERFVSQARAFAAESGFECEIPSKPKSDSSAAQSMRQKRASPFKDCKTLGEVDSTLKNLESKVPAIEFAKAQVAALQAKDKIIKCATKENEKARKDDPLRKSIIAIIAAMDDKKIQTLNKSINLFLDLAESEYKRAWSALFNGISPKALAALRTIEQVPLKKK
jgi:hypothetical protein